MDTDRFLQSDVQDFILWNKSVDIKTLALKKIPFDVNLRSQILQHIHAYQKALFKLKKWTTPNRIIFPNPDLIEQASSDETADYKAAIFSDRTFKDKIFLDLSAGLGSDALALSKWFRSGYCVEADPAHAQLLEYNLKILSKKKIDVLNDYAENIIDIIPNVDLIYIDPQRRNESGKRGLYDLSQTQPNILQLLPILKQKSPRILLKTSPYLDITEGIKQLGSVQEVHIVEHEKQCKEVLYYIDQTRPERETRLISAIAAPRRTYETPLSASQSKDVSLSDPLTFLYEPCTALMKSNTHEGYAQHRGLQKIAPMTHLYTTTDKQADFMGRGFEVITTLPVKKRELYDILPDKQANISVRNFPMKPDDLRRKLQIKDGGDITIFGCTLQNGTHKLVVTRKT